METSESSLPSSRCHDSSLFLLGCLVAVGLPQSSVYQHKKENGQWYFELLLCVFCGMWLLVHRTICDHEQLPFQAGHRCCSVSF